MTNYVLVAMVDLFRVRVFFRLETDQAGAETFALGTALVVNLPVDLLKLFEGLWDLYDFHGVDLNEPAIGKSKRIQEPEFRIQERGILNSVF